MVDFGDGANQGVVKAAPRFGDAVMLDRVVARLQDIRRQTGVERTLAIGELVLVQFFGGSVDEWRNRRRNKNNSIRRLADRGDCPFSKSALNEAVAVYVASLTLGCVQTFGHIGPSHVAAVLKLPVEERESVLRWADSQRLSVRELNRHVVVLRRSRGEHRGRPAVEAGGRVLGLLRSSLEDLSAAAQLIATSTLDAATLSEVSAAAERILSASSGLSPTHVVRASFAGPVSTGTG
jgi:hypothetical protein